MHPRGRLGRRQEEEFRPHLLLQAALVLLIGAEGELCERPQFAATFLRDHGKI